tara:strand:- start:10538 stop:11605 length:1068 start_codon:yes stop_codon:yes gene_type:complete
LDLGNKLEIVPHREVAGSDSYAAFEFQLVFGVEILFENFDKLTDYAVLFEFHDDIVLLTGTDSPTEIEFFQLKHTTSGNWTIPKFCEQDKAATSGKKKPSMLHRLYENVENFGDFSKNAQIVSNAYYSDIGQSGSTQFDALEEANRNKILTHIQERFPSATVDCLSVLGFRRTELQKSSALDLVKGRVHTFLQDKIGGDAFQLQACTDAIVSQCRIRNKKLATDVNANIQDIITQKGLARTDVESWLKEIAAEKNAPDWSVVQNSLGDGVAFSDLNESRKAYEDHRITALDAGNDAQNAVVRRVRQALIGGAATAPLWTFIEQLIEEENLMEVATKNGHTISQLRAILIYEIFKS